MGYSRFCVYVAFFTKTIEGLYYAEFPDLPGCFTQGKNLKETFCKAQEALAIYYKEKWEEMPASTDIDELRKRAGENTIVQLVSVDTKNYGIKSMKAIKKTLTIPEWLSDIAEKYPINYSQILKNGLIEHLKELDSLTDLDRSMLND